MPRTEGRLPGASSAYSPRRGMDGEGFAAEHAAHFVRVEPGGVDHHGRGNRLVRRRHLSRSPAGAAPTSGEAAQDGDAGGFGAPCQGANEGFRLDAAGGRRPQPGHARPRAARAPAAKAAPTSSAVDAVAGRAGRQGFEGTDSSALAATMNLPQRACGTAFPAAKAYSRSRPSTQSAALSEPERVVDAGMDDAAVPRAGFVPQPRMTLQQAHRRAGLGNGERAREPRHAPADDGDVDFGHAAP